MTVAARPTARRYAVPLVEVTVTEEFDASVVPQVGAVLKAALDLRPGQIVLDLSDCAFVDAAAIGLLLDVHRRAWQADGRLTLRSPTPRLLRILQVARVAHVLDIEQGRSTEQRFGCAPPAPVLAGESRQKRTIVQTEQEQQ